MRAQLRGIKRRHETTGTPPILIHTVRLNFPLRVPALIPSTYSRALVNKSIMLTYASLDADVFSLALGVVADFTASGKFSYDTIHSDLEVEKIESIPSTAIHRNVDSEIVKADTEGRNFIDSYLGRTDTFLQDMSRLISFCLDPFMPSRLASSLTSVSNTSTPCKYHSTSRRA